ncbi:hypothetical protein T05_12125 [Trichinella murrelli]|uniref:Uncharacterized protein n=1 Tax=Trichinella murrelli TaxID=144512 RepID=A0A0V0SWB0_9BILA|nr:hypothetical protein T05_12125 [Trichinella murrelli]
MDEMCALYESNCNQEQVKYLRMFVMPHLEQTDVNMTKHGVQSESKGTLGRLGNAFMSM